MQFKVSPWIHQRLAIEKGAALPHLGLFMDMGVGKTATAIHLYRTKCKQENHVLRCLVIAPGVTLHNWRREYEMHCMVCPKVTILEGTGTKRYQTFLNNKDSKVFITAYETLLMEPMFKALKDWRPEVLIVDESHRTKSPDAKRTQRTLDLSKLARYRYILTGTPVLNDVRDLFTQLEILDHGKTFPTEGKTLKQKFNKFLNRYFIDLNAGMPKHKHFPMWKPKDGAIDEIRQKLNPIAVSVKKSQCLDLPPLIKQQLHVDLAPEQRRLYDSMKKDFIAYVEDEACVATLAITKGLRLQQIVSGFVTLTSEGEEPKNVPLKDNPRAEATEELLENICKANKCIVWAVFRENYAVLREICKRLKLGFVELHGEVAPEKRQAAIDAFNTNENIRVLIGNPSSGGIGINLVSASYAIFYSRTFSLEADLQAEARNYRGGSERHEKITRIDLIAKGTIDELIFNRLSEKQEIGNKVLQDIARELKNGKQ